VWCVLCMCVMDGVRVTCVKWVVCVVCDMLYVCLVWCVMCGVCDVWYDVGALCVCDVCCVFDVRCV